MLTIKEWMELVDYRITEGSDFQWDCYGRRVYVLDSWNGIHEQGGYSFSIVFGTEDQTVYEVSVCDYTNDRAYRMINEDFQKKMRKEAKRRDVDKDQAWDDVAYVDLDVADDFIQKSLAIKAGEEYDTRVTIALDIPEDELMTMFKAAHAMDITFNEFVEQACTNAIEEYGVKIDD
jgi:hypothetical protein